MAAVWPPLSSGLRAVPLPASPSQPADTVLLSSPSRENSLLDICASPVSDNREFVFRDTPNHTEFTKPHRPLSVSKSSPVVANRTPQLSPQSYPALSPPNNKPLLSPPRRVLIATTKASSPGTSKYFPSSVIHRPISPVTHQLLISPQKSGVNFTNSSPALHRPLIAQRSSPALHRSTVVRTPVTSPPKSPLLFTRSSRKLSCPRVTRVSPSQFKYSFQYSKVPKSDSAYSEEPYSYSPVPSSYSPSSDYPYTCRAIPKSETTYSDLNYSYSPCIPKSDSAYSEQYTNSSFRPKSSVPKSQSTIFRSDSAFSDIEYSYSTIPQSESYYQDKNCSYSSLPKSDSVYSENILSTSNCNRSNFIPRSFSAHNPQLECETENIPPASSKASPALVHSASQAHIPTTTQFIFPKSHSSYFCSTSPTSLIMPTLKSFFKPPSRQPIPSRPSKYDRHPKRSDVSVHSLKLISLSSPEPSIKKSHTVLALSSNLSSNGAASTKLLSKEAPHSCNISGCLTRSLKQSLSQTFNQSIGHNLNIPTGGADTNPQHKRSRRRSNLSAFIPRSFSRSSSIAPSVTSGGGSYVGSCGGGEGDTLYCRLCLMDVSVNMMCQLTVCQCRFCRYCLTEYTRVKIEEGEHRIECPDASCEGGEGGRMVGELTSEEVGALVGRDLLMVRNRIKLSAEVAADPFRAWCPKPGCETIVHLSKSKFVSNASGGPSTRTSSSKPPSTLTVSTLPPSTIFSTSGTSKSATTATMSVPFLPNVPSKKTRTRRFGTTVNVYAKSSEKENSVPSSPKIEPTLLEVDESRSVDIAPNLPTTSVDNSNPVDSVNTSLDVYSPTNSALGDSVVISCTNADLTNGNNIIDNNNRAAFRTSVVGSVQIVNSNMENIGHIDMKSEAPRGTIYASPEKRKESFDDVNMIKCIGPSSPPSVPRRRPSGLDDFPADPNLSATLAGLQSPAEYRPFASLSEAGSLRVLPGVPELSEGGEEWARCSTCRSRFCPRCSRLGGHASSECPAPTTEQTGGLRRQYKKLVGDVDDFQGQIKSCPNLKCQVYIERNEGCAQMQCRACKHTFCWYCRASLEEDFLLRHYDSGPCRNKLGHSRASVLCHRLQVLAIFLGVGLLVLAASPLLLVVGPCMLCCKCRPEARGASMEDNDA